jgi:MurNAc alpha-1-phosphate uridylyltransferase
MSLPVAILAGGLATRLGTVAERIPKALLDVGGRPFAEHQIELLKTNGITDVVYLVGHLGDMIERTMGDGGRWGIRIRYGFDGPKSLGTGGAIRQALPLLGERFFVLYGDSYLECDYAAIERAFAASGHPAIMTVCRNSGEWDQSNVVFSDGRIVTYDKRRLTPAMRHIDYGLGAFHRSAFDAHAAGEAFDLVEVYQELLARNELAGFDVPGRYYEIGSLAGLDETRAYLKKQRVNAP